MKDTYFGSPQKKLQCTGVHSAEGRDVSLLAESCAEERRRGMQRRKETFCDRAGFGSRVEDCKRF